MAFCKYMNQLGRYLRTARRISRTRYPRFIFGLPPSSDSIPVFTYHDVEPESLARDLEFLRTNGYRTLSLDEFLETRARSKTLPQRSVLLTFDDARKSFGTVALPLLKSFGAHAVLFAPSFWMSHPPCSGGDLFMTWDELRQCAKSGVVDIESHAHRHALIAVGENLVDFAHPAALQQFDIYDWPMRQMGSVEELGHPALGTPIYRAAPLLSANRRYIESAQLTLACREHVACNGGLEFFRRVQWRRELLGVYREQSPSRPGRWLSDREFRALVTSEFELSRAQFQHHLGYAPRTLAYPWMLGSDLSLELARDTGFTSAFGVALDFGAERKRNKALPVFGRFKCDWLRFLPGNHRSSMFGTLRRKVSGFASSQHLAH